MTPNKATRDEVVQALAYIESLLNVLRTNLEGESPRGGAKSAVGLGPIVPSPTRFPARSCKVVSDQVAATGKGPKP